MSETVKFWVYVNEPTKLKMQKGDVLNHVSGGATDEGWSYDCNTWEFDGEVVTYRNTTNALDCDGRHDHYYSAVCPVDKLRNGHVTEDEIAFPVWQKLEDYQRDHFAEAMGY